MAKMINIQTNLDASQFNQQMQNLQNAKYNVNVNVNSANNINTVTNQMQKLNSRTYDTNSVFGKLRNAISNTFSSGKVAMTSYLLVLRELNQAAKSAKQSIEEIDEAITNLSVATNESRESVAELVKEYNRYAKELSATTTDITSAADDYLRAGKSMSETQTLIQDSIMLSKLGQIESSEATEDLLATMNGFGMSVEEVGNALDAMVAIDMEAATSAGDIATALKYCASNADVAGLSFNSLAAMIGTVQDKTQQSASVVGTFFNTLLSRYKDVKIGNYLDDDGEDISDYESVLKSVGIQLRDSQGEFRNYEDVLADMADAWDSLSSTQQAALAKTASGTRQQNRFYALMENYSKTLELTEVAATSAGTAIEKYENSYVDSIEAMQNRLQASFESLVIDTNIEEVYKGILGATTALTEFIDKANALKGIATGIATSAFVKAFLSFKTGITQAYVALNQFQSALTLVNSNTKVVGNDFTRLLLLTKNLSESQTRLILSSKSLTLTQKQQILMNQGLTREEARLKLQNYGLATSYTGLQKATTSVSNAFKGLWATIKANPLMLVTTAVSATTVAWQKYKQVIEESRQKAVEIAETYSETQSSLEEQIDSYKELRIQLDKGNLSTDEARSVKEQLLEIQQSLIGSYGNEASNLDLVNGKYETQLGLLTDISKAKAEQYIAENQSDYNMAKQELQEIRTYKVGTVAQWGTWAPETEDQKKLKNYLQEYSELFDVYESGFESVAGKGVNLDLEVNANVGDANEVLHNLAIDLKQWGKENSIDVDGILSQISVQLDETWTDELEDYKTIYDQFVSAQIVASDTLRPLYNDSIQAVEAYNTALASGEGVEEAKENLDSLKQSVADTTDEVEGSQGVFDDIFGNVNESLEKDYDLTQKFESDEVQKIAKQLKGLTDIDLQAVNFDNDNTEKGEQAFKSLMETLGLTTDDAQLLIDKLVELDYVQGKTSGSTTTLSESFTKSDVIDCINDMSDGFDKLSEVYQDVADGGTFDFSKLNTKKFKEAFEDLDLGDVYNDFIDTVAQFPNDITKCQTAFDNLTTAYINQSGVMDMINEDTADTAAAYLKLMNVQNADEVVATRLKAQNEYLTATGKELKDATNEEISAFLNECEASKETKQYLAQLALQKVSLNNIDINTSSDIEQILNLAEAAGAGAKALAELAKAKAVLAQVEAGSASGMQYINSGAYDEAMKTISDIESGLYDFDFSIDRTKFNINAPDTSSSKSSTDSKKSFDWIEVLIQNIEDEISRLDNIVNSSYKNFTEKNEALSEQLKLVNNEVELYQKAYDGYMQKAESIKLSDHYKDLVINGAINVEDITDKDLQTAINDYQEWYGKAKECQDKITELTEKALDLRVSQYENCADELDKLREDNVISEKEYIDRMTALWREYYENQVEMAEVAKEKKLEILKEEKEYLESVASAASSVIGRQVDSLEDERDGITDAYDEQIKGYESQIKEIENIIKGYEDQIDALEELKKPIQEQLDLLEEEEDREDKILNLQKAQYNLARAENQRSQLTYVDGQMVRTTSSSDITDARQELKEAELELQKFNLQTQIDAYDKQIDAINDIIDGYNDQIDAINDVIDSINDLIDETNDYYDKQVKALEKIQDEWEKIIDKYEEAVDLVNLKSMFGDDAVQRILEGDITLIEQFGQTYTDVLSEIDLTANGTIGEITQQYSQLANTDLSNLSKQTQNIAGKFDTLTESVINTSASITGDGSNDTTLVGAMQESYSTATEMLPAESEMMDGLTTSTDIATNAVNGLRDAIDALPTEKTITINVVTNGSVPNINGYAKGTRKADEGIAVVAEEKPEIIVTNSGKTLLADKPTVVEFEGGETVYDGNATEKMLDRQGNEAFSGFVGKLSPLPEDSPVMRILRRIESGNVDIGSYVPNNVFDSGWEKTAGRIINNSSTINNNQSAITLNGGINITCPGVTSQEVVAQVKKTLDHEFFGMANNAYQRSKRSR